MAQCSAAAATALHPVSITSHRKPARKMSLKSKSVPFSDLSPGLSREMLQWRQWRQYAMHLTLTRAPPDGLVTFTPRAWAVVHHHHEGDSWFLLTLSLTRHSDTSLPTLSSYRLLCCRCQNFLSSYLHSYCARCQGSKPKSIERCIQ